MKKSCIFLAALILLLPLSGCYVPAQRSETFFFMDTVIGVTLYTRDNERAEAAFDSCHTLLGELEALWSRHTETSEISKFNASEQGIDAPDPRTVALLQAAIEVAQGTDGAFDPTVTPLITLWDTAGERDRLPTDAELAQALSRVDYAGLEITSDRIGKTDPNLALDLGGIGKGAAVSALLDLLKASGVEGGLVTFGSNVAVFGKKPNGEPFRVALRDPKNANATVGILPLGEGQILSVSGDYERYVTVGGERYHHILDPQSGYPAKSGLSSVAVIASDGALADALSTALLVMGGEKALELHRSGAFSFEAILISSSGAITLTDGLRDRFEAA